MSSSPEAFRSKTPDPNVLPFDVIREPLEKLIVATINKLDREWPAKWGEFPGAPGYFRGSVQLADYTFQSIRFLCADKPENHARKLEFSVSTPPLSRTILDSIFTFIFLLEDFPARWRWFEKSGWREAEDQYERFASTYKGDPAWDEFFKSLREYTDFIKKSAAIGPAEEKNRKLIPWWPNPGKMPGQAGGWRKDYLIFLNDWFYRQLSAESHLSLIGFGARGGFIFAPDNEARTRVLEKSKSNGVFTTVTLITALLSEVEMEFHYGHNDKLKYIWGIIEQYWGEAKDLYSRRYIAL